MLPVLLLGVLSVAAGESCYWNRPCPNLLHSTKTAYETVRGDIRDYSDPESCSAVSLWTLHRHGNRNPGSAGADMKQLVDLVQGQLVEAYEAGRSQLCAQDLEALRKWRFNETILSAASHLTGTGYEELHDIGKRLRLRYPHLLQSAPQDYYFRPTDSQRTVASAMGFVHGLTDDTALHVTFDEPFPRDDVIRPYENCEKYQQEVRGGALLEQQLEDYAKTAEYVAMQKAVQDRLGITHQLSADEVYTLYEACRYHRTWAADRLDAWCAAFSDQDLVVLEYRDDVRHYYRNGYGSWVNQRLAGPLLKDLRERFQAAARGEGQKVVSYFSHNAMTEMTFVALGLFRDAGAVAGASRDPTRKWRTSFIAAFATNMIVVLNKCTESGSQTHRVQFFINEKPTELCSLSGCSWDQFEELVKDFDDNLEFCNLDYPDPEPAPAPAPGAAAAATRALATGAIIAQAVIVITSHILSIVHN